MPHFMLLTHSPTIRKAQHRLVARFAAGSRRACKYRIGFPSGDLEAMVRYLPAHDIWHAQPLTPLRNRYWNGFGVGDPKRVALTPTVEINPSFTGSRRCAGLFLEDECGRLHLAHTGRIGGGCEGVGKRAFLPRVRERLVSVGDNNQDVLIGRIDSRGFCRELKEFIGTVQEFKRVARGKLPLPKVQDECVPARARAHKYGGEGESDEHKQLKLYIASHPKLLGLGTARAVYVEYPYLSGDRVDVMVELAKGGRVVIEVERRGDLATLIGAHQAIKYRALMAAEAGVSQREVRAVLVAHHIPKNTDEFCKQHRIRTKEIPLASMARE